MRMSGAIASAMAHSTWAGGVAGPEEFVVGVADESATTWPPTVVSREWAS